MAQRLTIWWTLSLLAKDTKESIQTKYTSTRGIQQYQTHSSLREKVEISIGDWTTFMSSIRRIFRTKCALPLFNNLCHCLKCVVIFHSELEYDTHHCFRCHPHHPSETATKQADRHLGTHRPTRAQTKAPPCRFMNCETLRLFQLFRFVGIL